MKKKTIQNIRRISGAIAIAALGYGAFREAGICTTILFVSMWINIVQLANVIQLQNDVLERIKVAMTGTLLVDKALRDAAEDVDQEQKQD